MSVEEACHRILGSRVAEAIISDQGLRRAIVAAMAAARDTDEPEALDAIRQAMRHL